MVGTAGVSKRSRCVAGRWRILPHHLSQQFLSIQSTVVCTMASIEDQLQSFADMGQELTKEQLLAFMDEEPAATINNGTNRLSSSPLIGVAGLFLLNGVTVPQPAITPLSKKRPATPINGEDDNETKRLCEEQSSETKSPDSNEERSSDASLFDDDFEHVLASRFGPYGSCMLLDKNNALNLTADPQQTALLYFMENYCENDREYWQECDTHLICEAKIRSDDSKGHEMDKYFHSYCYRTELERNNHLHQYNEKVKVLNK